MPLKLGTTSISGIYKGTTPIVKVYKGTTLVFAAYTWQEWLTNYLYHTLIPTALNNRALKNTAKLGVISGNSEVENQLWDWENVARYSGTNLNPLTIVGTKIETTVATAGTGSYQWGITNGQATNIVSGHRYLVIFSVYSNANVTQFGFDRGSWISTTPQVSYTSGQTLTSSFFFVPTSNAISYFIARFSGTYAVGDTIRINYLFIIDLTQRYPFDTPITLTDPRVQNIINGGYEDYNSGEIKNTVITELESESFNLFDENVIGGYYDSSTGVYSNSLADRCCSKNLTQVLPNSSYKIEVYTTMDRIRVFYFDENKNYISYSTSNSVSSLTFTTPSNCKFIEWDIYQSGSNWTTTPPSNSVLKCCIHINGTRTGYAPHKPTQYLPSEYQEVEYLESSGTQYIDSGFKPNNNTNADLTFSLSSHSGSTVALFGCLSSGDNRFAFLVSSQQKLVWHYGATDTSHLSLINLNTKYIVKNVGLDLYLDNSLEYTSVSRNFTTTENAYLFGRNSEGSLSNQSFVKLYSCKIYDNGTLIRNFIPCYRKSDNVAGLYDLVNNVFYTNAGTGTFAIGKKVNNNTIIRLPAPLEVAGVNTAKNSLTVTDSGYVFTRKAFDVDLGTLNYSREQQGDFYVFQNNFSSILANTQNIICSKYPLSSNWWQSGQVDKSIYNGSRLRIRDDSYTDTTTFKTAMSGVLLTYQLATPQTITIPRKHLGVVDLGSLDYQKGTYVFYTTLQNVNGGKGYCGLYIYDSSANANKQNMSLSISSSGVLEIKNNSYTNATDFKNAMNGVYLYYETSTETQDFVDEMYVESGGALNGNLFSWVENQLVTNGNFESTSGWVTTNSTLSVSDNVMSFVATSSDGNVHTSQNINGIANHTYLVVCKVKLTTPTTDVYVKAFGGNVEKHTQATTNWQTLSYKATLQSSINALLLVADGRSSGWDAIQVKDVMCIDLTVAFGAGNEPTSVNDYRVQEIINKGYIPTNTSGTYTQETCEVLPSVEMIVKCK